MRDLSIRSGHAFLIVFSMRSSESLEWVKARLALMNALRSDLRVKIIFDPSFHTNHIRKISVNKKKWNQDIPIVVAGNKVDRPIDIQTVQICDVENWIREEFPEHRFKIMFSSTLM